MSAVFGGLPARAVERAMREDVILSEAIRAEWIGVAERLDAKLTADQQAALKARLAGVVAGARVVAETRRVRLCRDATDDAYLSLALAAEADVLLTGDKDLLSLSRARLAPAGLDRLSILAPRAFLARFRP